MPNNRIALHAGILASFVLMATLPVLIAASFLSPEVWMGRAAQGMKSIADAPGPKWGTLFDADGMLRDEIDGFGARKPNGIPDVIDSGAKGAVFIRDEVSAGVNVDNTILAGSDSAWTSGTLPPDEDLGNAYVYEETNAEGRLILYLGLERITAAADTTVEFELNQRPFWLEELRQEGSGRILGARSVDDLLVRMHYGESGALRSADVFKWSGNSESGQSSSQWIAIGALEGVGCNQGGSLCALTNSDYIAGEKWKSFDASGNATGTLAPFTFAELGIDVSGIVGRDPGFIGVQVRTALDFALAHIMGSVSGEWVDAGTPDEGTRRAQPQQIEGQSIAGITGGHLLFAAPSHIQFTLQGCRNDGTLTLPDGAGRYICPDDSYVSGNLGKGWNELDLVPHRLTTQSGNQAASTATYSVIVAADSRQQEKIGYDVISEPIVNPAKSDVSCTVTAGPQSVQAGTAGGADEIRYRELTVHQDKGTTCVFDFHQRLGLGAHLFPGSSLQSYMFESQDLQSGRKTLSIPANEILGQGLKKDMSASQGANHVWEVTKSPAQATLTFPNTCDTTSQGVEITVSWKRLPATPNGDILIVTHAYATNPAAREITILLRDTIYSGATPLDSYPRAGDLPVSVDIPANTADMLVLSHTFTVPGGTSNLNDVATASYWDKETEVAVPGQITATAPAIVQASGPEIDLTAVVKELETITGAGLRMSANSFTGSAGEWDSHYPPGTRTPSADWPSGQISWTSALQNGSGSVTFRKTVYVDSGTVASGHLKDQTTLIGSDKFTTVTPPSDFSILAGAKASLGITASLDTSIRTKVTLYFEVKNLGSGIVLDTMPVITINQGQTSGSTTVPALDQGQYRVTVVKVDNLSGFTGLAQDLDLSAPKCSATASFKLEANGNLQVTKTVNWNGVPPDNQAFEICIQGPSYAEGPDCKTTKGGTLMWNNLIPGSYSISESDPGNSWISTVIGSPVIVPASGGQATATVANIKKSGNLLVTKSVEWNGVAPDGQEFEICIQGPSYSAPNCKTTKGGTLTWNNLAPGQYTVTETNPGSNWDSSITGSPVLVTSEGVQGTATVTNSRKSGGLLVTKNVEWNGVAPDGQEFEICIQGPSFSAPNCKTTKGGTLTWNNLAPGQYTVTETNPGSSWNSSIAGSPALVTSEGVQGTVIVTNSRKSGNLLVTKNVEWNGVVPDGQAFEICIQGPSYATPNCKTTKGGTLTWNNLAPGQYTVTETNPGSNWNSAITGSPVSVLPEGGQGTATVTNTRKPEAPAQGGQAHSIGYWKNWASCSGSNGRQAPVLDQTLALAGTEGISIGILALHGEAGNPNEAPDCSKAVRLLNKSNIDKGAKRASDASFNLAAQLLAADLNVLAGARVCTAASDAIHAGQSLLAAIAFNGVTHNTMSSAQITQAHQLAGVLDNYNNNRLCQ